MINERGRKSERERKKEGREKSRGTRRGKRIEESSHTFPSLSKKKTTTTTVAFATTEALEEIARVVQQNVSAWWKWKSEGADAGVALENEIVASKN